jgi:hypothetical protein
MIYRRCFKLLGDAAAAQHLLVDRGAVEPLDREERERLLEELGFKVTRAAPSISKGISRLSGGL